MVGQLGPAGLKSYSETCGLDCSFNSCYRQPSIRDLNLHFLTKGVWIQIKDDYEVMKKKERWQTAELQFNNLLYNKANGCSVLMSY